MGKQKEYEGRRESQNKESADAHMLDTVLSLSKTHSHPRPHYPLQLHESFSGARMISSLRKSGGCTLVSAKSWSSDKNEPGIAQLQRAPFHGFLWELRLHGWRKVWPFWVTSMKQVRFTWVISVALEEEPIIVETIQHWKAVYRKGVWKKEMLI